MSLRRHAQTDAQEESLAMIERLAKTNNISIWYGTSIGKSPQSIVLDMTHQGGEIHVNSNGNISIHGQTDIDLPPKDFANELGCEDP